VFDFLTHLINGSAVSYVVVLGIVAMDSFFPVLPGETAMITGGVLAANGDLSIPLVVVAGWAGGVLGDNVTWLLGRALGARARRRLFTSDKALHRLAWAETQLELRGLPIIVTARFIPGGRTATMFSAGSLDMPWRRFVAADVVAAGLWAGYAAGLGIVGGSTFQHSVWKPLAVAMVVAVLVTIGGEVYRRTRLRGDERRVARRFRRFRREARQAQREQAAA
jgi:membrane protein DedA with SNARE-associated domain